MVLLIDVDTVEEVDEDDDDDVDVVVGGVDVWYTCSVHILILVSGQGVEFVYVVYWSIGVGVLKSIAWHVWQHGRVVDSV